MDERRDERRSLGPVKQHLSQSIIPFPTGPDPCTLTGPDPFNSIARDPALDSVWEQLRGFKATRLSNEWKRLRRCDFDLDGFLVEFKDLVRLPDVRLHLSVNLAGPEGSPYHGQVFVLDVLLEDFPYNPPRLRFDTPVLHPNISPSTGELAIGGDWMPSYTVYEVLLAVRRLLAEPDAENAADPEVASMYLHQHPEFLEMVRARTNPSSDAHDPQVSDLAILGQAADVLESALGAASSDSLLSVIDAVAILNELASLCPRLQALLHAHEVDGSQLDQHRLLVTLHAALALELGRETPDSI